jgi:hypothetical protein
VNAPLALLAFTVGLAILLAFLRKEPVAAWLLASGGAGLAAVFVVVIRPDVATSFSDSRSGQERGRLWASLCSARQIVWLSGSSPWQPRSSLRRPCRQTGRLFYAAGLLVVDQ